MHNNRKVILIFISAILVFLYLANLVVYEATLIIFNLSNLSFLVMSILGVLGVSFIASIFLGMRYYNIFTRTYSTIAMSWMGFFIYFFLASVIYILEYLFIGDASRCFAFALFGLIILAGIYGVFHKRKLVVKEVKVNISNIYDIWLERKIVWISDLHIGQINGKKFVERVIEKLRKISPDILFIGGDLFDGSSAEGILKCISPFKKLPVPLGMYFVMGNHEGFGNSEIFSKTISDVGIRILNNEKIIIDGLQIVGVDYLNTSKESDYKKIIDELKINRNIPSILLKHEPRFINITESAGISLQISGHTHKAQQWPLEYLARLIYGRFTYGLNRLGNTQVYTSSGTGTWGPPIRVGTDCEIIVFKLSAHNK